MKISIYFSLMLLSTSIVTFNLHSAAQPEEVLEERIQAPIETEETLTQAQKNERLIESAARGDIVEIKRLIEMGADVNGEKKGQIVALTQAASNGHRDAVELLIKKCANVNHIDERSWTALIHTAFPVFPHTPDRNKSIMELLINACADVNIVNTGGGSAFRNVVEDACRYYPPATDDRVELLLNANANIDAADMFGWTALMKASSGYNQYIVKILLDRGADLNLRNEHGQTALDLLSETYHLNGERKTFREETFKLLNVEPARRQAGSERYNEIITCLKKSCLPNVLVDIISGYSSNTLGEPDLIDQAASKRRKEIITTLNEKIKPIVLVEIIDSYLPAEVTDYIDASKINPPAKKV